MSWTYRGRLLKLSVIKHDNYSGCHLTASKRATTFPIVVVFADICTVPGNPYITTPGIELKGNVLRWIADRDLCKVTSLGSVITYDLFISRFGATGQMWLRMAALDVPLDSLGLHKAQCRNQRSTHEGRLHCSHEEEAGKGQKEMSSRMALNGVTPPSSIR
jgi:hypothetical protein